MVVEEKKNAADSALNELAEVLKFYHESGVDCTLQDSQEKQDTTKKSECLSLTPKVAKKPKVDKQLMSDWVVSAREIAERCSNLEELRKAVTAFEGCEIKKSAINTVFSDGNPHAKIMLIGEAPGSNEDREGIPFCGASGMLLEKMLAAIGLNRKNTYISNTVFWRPPGNRRPTDLELEVCKPFVEKHIALISPEILVLIGGTACYALLQTVDSISKLRGRMHQYENAFLSKNITTVVTFHPAYLLRQPMQKRLAWEDLKLIKAYIEQKGISTDF